jgi:hypothetical protein
MVFALDNLIKSGLEECIPVIKSSHPSLWGKKAMKVGRLIANIEDGWLEARAYFASWKTESRFTIDDYKVIAEALQGTYEDLDRVHRMMHEVEIEVIMGHDKVMMAIEALVSLHNAMGPLCKHLEECMIVECGLTQEEKDKTIAHNKQGPGINFFHGNVEDLFRRLRGEDVD